MSLKKNVIANYLGIGWTAAMGLIFVPYYIKYLGMEAYGLIGFYTVLQACLMLLDMGLTPTVSREMARFTGGEHTHESIKNLLRSLELVCFSIAAFYCFFIWLGADWVAQNWLQANKLPKTVVSQAFLIMGWVSALRFIEGLYRGAILGLQKQVTLNLINASMATLRGFGAVLILAYVEPSIYAYFVWQGIVSILTLGIFVFTVYSCFPEAKHAAKFSKTEFVKVWRFAAGVMTTSLLALALSQIDKLVLSRILPLEEFGSYSLVATVVSVLTMMVGPITQAHYPKISELKSLNEIESLQKVFWRGSQLATAISGAAAFTLIFFGNRILAIWTGNEELSEKIFPLLRLMSIGTFLNGLIHMPYVLQLAYGWTGFAAKVNLIAIIFLLPAMLWLTPIYGAIGAAWIWITLNVYALTSHLYLVSTKIFPSKERNNPILGMLKPIISINFVLLIAWVFKPEIVNRLIEFLYITCSAFFALTFAIYFSPELRQYVNKLLTNFQNRHV